MTHFYALEPRTRHPLIWVLTDLLGIPRRDIRRLAKVTRTTLEQMDRGHSPPTPARYALAALARATQVAAAALPPMFTEDPVVDDLRRHLHRVIDHVVRAAERPPPAVYRETDLSRELVAQVSRRGALRGDVFAALTPAHTRAAVRRAARRIGIRESTAAGKVWWHLPADRIAPATPPPPSPPVYTPPAGRRSNRLQAYMMDKLVSLPEGEGYPAEKLVAEMRARGFSRTLVYKLARELCLIRETTGFGPSKLTLWALRKSTADTQPIE